MTAAWRLFAIVLVALVAGAVKLLDVPPLWGGLALVVGFLAVLVESRACAPSGLEARTLISYFQAILLGPAAGLCRAVPDLEPRPHGADPGRAALADRPRRATPSCPSWS